MTRDPVAALRQQARAIENELDVTIESLVKLSSGTGLGMDPRDVEEGQDPLLGEAQMIDRLQDEIKNALDKLASLGDEMEQTVGSNPSAAASTQLRRHREVLASFQAEFKRTRGKITSQRKSRDLIGDVRRDITDHRQSGGTHALLRERTSIANSNAEIDSILGQAYGITETLANQRRTFGNITNKMTALAERIPMVNDLMTKIKARKDRDKYIMALTVGLCFCFLVWWTFL